MESKRDEYFSDDCIVKDEFYSSIKDFIICPLCHKIFKEPYMCDDCQEVFCKKCLENDSNLKICPGNKKNVKFVKCIQKANFLSKLKYKCKNCLKEIYQIDIPAHLEENCERTEKADKEKTLAEIIYSKKELIKLTKIQMKNKQPDYKMTSKYKLSNINLIFHKYSNNFRNFRSRKVKSY